MMRLKYFLTSKHNQLRDDIEKNLAKYAAEHTWIDSVFDERFDAEARIEITLPALIESPDSSKDIDNVKLIYPALKHLTVEQAMDGRLWTHLTHVEYWNYMRKRWDVDGENIKDGESIEENEKKQKLAKKIKERYFLYSEDNSRALIRNGIARLWWFGYLTYDSNNSEAPFALTQVLLEYQDIQAALLERTFGKNRDILQICLIALREKMDEIKNSGGRAKEIIQDLGKYVNLLGGTYFLDTMDKTMLKEKITAFIDRKLIDRKLQE